MKKYTEAEELYRIKVDEHLIKIVDSIHKELSDKEIKILFSPDNILSREEKKRIEAKIQIELDRRCGKNKYTVADFIRETVQIKLTGAEIEAKLGDNAKTTLEELKLFFDRKEYYYIQPFFSGDSDTIMILGVAEKQSETCSIGIVLDPTRDQILEIKIKYPNSGKEEKIICTEPL